MTIHKRLTLRFTGSVSSILLLAFVSIYAFCWYFVTSDFYRRLDRKAGTTGDMLIRHRLDRELIRQLSSIRRDQLPDQRIMIYDSRDSLIFWAGNPHPPSISQSMLSDIRKNKQRDFQLQGYYLSGSRYMTAAGPFIVLAGARNVYGDAFLWRLLWALTGLFVLTVGITALIGWLFSGDAIRPMQLMDQTLAHIFPHNRDERLTVGEEDDEISRLSVSINGLLDRVGESLQLQRMFVANVSHELKNPLTQISSQLEVCLLNQRTPEAYRQTIRSVLEDVGELSDLTHELLQLSQVNQEDASGSQRAARLTDLVRIDELIWDIRDRVTAQNPGYQVVIQLGPLPDDPDELAVVGNETLLCTALKNLTENACKFATDGRAQIHVQFSAERVQLTVQNEGQPIPAADLPYIFEPFYRSRQTAGQVRGYGVGLSLVHRIIHLHGGRVLVTSAKGQPTVFRVVLPKGSVPPLLR